MSKRVFCCVLVLIAIFTMATPGLAWNLVLVKNAEVDGSTVHLADIVRDPVPDSAGAMVVFNGGRPGQKTTVSRRTHLKKSRRGLSNTLYARCTQQRIT